MNSSAPVSENETSISVAESSSPGVPSLPIVYTVLEACVAVSAVFGNLLVILVFLQDRRLRKVTNFYIISLSVADLLVGAIGIPSAILTRIGLPRNSMRLCLTMLSLLVVLCTISILNLVAVSLDRYWAILHPLDYHKRISEKTALVIICVCWILGSAVGFLPLFGWNNGHLASDACFFIPIMNYNFLMFLYFATIVLPAVVMAFFYIRIYIVVVQQLSLNKVRQLNSNEFTLAKMKPHKGKLEGLSYSPHYKKNSKTLLKLSTPAGTPQLSAIHRFKSFKSVSSQLNEMETHESRVLQCHNGHLPSSSGSQLATELPSHSLTSLSLSGRHLGHFNLGSKSSHDHLHRSSHQALDRAERHNSKERKWRSLWNMSGDERPAEKKHSSTTSSVISSFYRTAHSGGKLSYSRREVKKAQKLFIIVVFFMVCWLPLYTSNTIQAFCPDCKAPSNTWLDFLIILSHINSAGSPFLYAFHMKDFRQALRRLVCKGAINKHKLRDIRREELFSISGRRNGHLHTIAGSIGATDEDESPVSKAEQLQHRGRFHSKDNSGQMSRGEQYRARRYTNVPQSCFKVEVDLEEAAKEDGSKH